MLFIKIYVQFVWSTKNKIPFLAIKEIRKIIWNHIRENAHKKGIRVDFINGYSNYYQCLIALEVDHTMDKVIELLKGEKTFWINKKGVSTELAPAELPPIIQDETNNSHKWQDHYFAVTVIESAFDRNNYLIQNQLNDDSKKIVNNYKQYLIQYGFKKFTDK